MVVRASGRVFERGGGGGVALRLEGLTRITAGGGREEVAYQYPIGREGEREGGMQVCKGRTDKRIGYLMAVGHKHPV